MGGETCSGRTFVFHTGSRGCHVEMQASRMIDNGTYSAVDPSFGSVFSFSGEYSYFRLAGTVGSGCGVGPCEVLSEGGRDARASRSVSGVRSIIEEMDCLIDPLKTGLGGVEASRGRGASSASGIERSVTSVLTRYESSRASSVSISSSSESSSSLRCSPSWSIAAGLSSVDARLLALTGGSGAFGS